MSSTEEGIEKRKRNLRPPWKPGESGNPKGGLPKEFRISTLIKNDLSKLKGKERATLAEKLKEKILQMALKGDKWALDTVLNRTEGKEIERILTTETKKDELVIE